MPDITMCKGEQCPMKERCYRFTATPSNYQSWFAEVPFMKSGNCNHHWPTTPKEKAHIESADCWCEPALVGDYESEGGVKHYLHKEVQ